MPLTRRPHQRSTAAVVLTRSDAPGSPTGEAAPHDSAVAPQPPRIWPTVLIWILLSSAIAALWAMLLLGDSLALNG